MTIFTHLDTTGEEDEVEGSFKKFGNFLSASRDGSDAAGPKYLGTRSSKSLLVAGRTFGEFENARIACRNDLDAGSKKAASKAR